MSGPAGRHSPRATRALTVLAERDPAFAALSLWVHNRDAEPEAAPPGAEGAPAWTDGVTVFYAPGFAAAADEEQVGLAAHQIAHVAFRHVPRGRALALGLGDRFDPALYGLAADAIVNEMLLLAGYVLPRPCPRLVPLLGEVLGERVTAEQALAAWDVERLTLALLDTRPQTAAPGRRAQPGRGGSPAEAAQRHARTLGYRPDLDLRHGAPGAGQEPEAGGDAERRQRLSRALLEGRLAGRGIGALTATLADLPASEVPWERHLRALAARALAAHPTPTWQRPTGRWLALDGDARRRGTVGPPFEPGQRRMRPVPRLALLLDTSSSVDGTTLALFAAQVAGIGRRVGGEVHLIVFDDGVRRQERMQGADWPSALARMPFSRGGGTDYAEAFERAAALTPSALVVLTDLGAPLPPEPRVPVIWGVPKAVRGTPGYGQVVRL